mmetsp:Transcript_48074/g.104704  ORF Transcript_48074/g.104704 Transcript_48074/m.104704 type:complete len:206 (-) Transcript_48074:1147-1764(-)
MAHSPSSSVDAALSPSCPWSSSPGDISSRLSRSILYLSARCSSLNFSRRISCSKRGPSTELPGATFASAWRSATCLRTILSSSVAQVASAFCSSAWAVSSLDLQATRASRATASSAWSRSSSASTSFFCSSRFLISSASLPASLKLRDATAIFFSASNAGICRRRPSKCPRNRTASDSLAADPAASSEASLVASSQASLASFTPF